MLGIYPSYNARQINVQPLRNPGSIPRTLDLVGGLLGRLTTLGPVAPAAAATCMLEEKGAPRLRADSELVPPVVFVDTDPTVRFGLRGDNTLLALWVLLPELVELWALSLRTDPPGVLRFVVEAEVLPGAPPKGVPLVDPLGKWNPETV